MRERLADGFRRFAFQRSFAHRPCAHVIADADMAPQRMTCSAREDLGITWVHLRMCLTCGSIGCCDSSRQRHTRAHFRSTGHPVMRSIEPGEEWARCYPDRAYLGSEELRAN